jgi:hypothetical protein
MSHVKKPALAKPADPNASLAHLVKLPYRPDSFKLSDLKRTIKKIRAAAKAAQDGSLAK